MADLPEKDHRDSTHQKWGNNNSDAKSVRSFLSKVAPGRQIEESVFGKGLYNMLQNNSKVKQSGR